ncbi:MAG: LytTR family DNA-binding domain-containing protein [Lachnospiraceae bacterium]
MVVRLKIAPQYKEPEIHICSDKEDAKTKEILTSVENLFGSSIFAYREEEVFKIPTMEIVKIYTENKNVYIATTKGNYRIRERLYEMESRLSQNGFVRISNTDLVNVDKIERLDTGITGTIIMKLSGGIEAYVSRRYVSKIKKALGI